MKTSSGRRMGALAFFFTLALGASAWARHSVPFIRSESQVSAGEFKRIYDPSLQEGSPWYINDHTFIEGPDHLWHMFGITHEEPADPLNEVHFAHATAPHLTDSAWQKQPFALTADPEQGEVHLWAPYVFLNEGLYYMYYCAGSPDHSQYRMHLATSRDLWHWDRHPGNPLFVDGYDARDPFVLRVAGRWVMYYTANVNPEGGNHVVAYRESSDLLHWGERHIALEYPDSGTYGGPTESPFVVQRLGRYYLFTGPVGGYTGTAVYESRDPLHFEVARAVGFINSHASEIVQDRNGDWYISHSGWGQGGLYLAPLFWPSVIGKRMGQVGPPSTLSPSPLSSQKRRLPPAQARCFYHG